MEDDTDSWRQHLEEQEAEESGLYQVIDRTANGSSSSSSSFRANMWRRRGGGGGHSPFSRHGSLLSRRGSRRRLRTEAGGDAEGEEGASVAEEQRGPHKDRFRSIWVCWNDASIAPYITRVSRWGRRADSSMLGESTSSGIPESPCSSTRLRSARARRRPSSPSCTTGFPTSRWWTASRRRRATKPARRRGATRSAEPWSAGSRAPAARRPRSCETTASHSTACRTVGK